LNEQENTKVENIVSLEKHEKEINNKKNVLDVTVNDTMFMEIFHCRGNLIKPFLEFLRVIKKIQIVVQKKLPNNFELKVIIKIY
jgi:hypothetical protein